MFCSFVQSNNQYKYSFFLSSKIYIHLDCDLYLFYPVRSPSSNLFIQYVYIGFDLYVVDLIVTILFFDDSDHEDPL